MLTNQKKQKAFSLVEVMIVVAIIGLLVAIAIPNFVRARTKTREEACRNNMRQLHNAGERYLLDNNAVTFTYGGDGTPLVGTPSYIKAAPTCPTDSSSYSVSVASQVITVTCGSGIHGSFDGSFQ